MQVWDLVSGERFDLVPGIMPAWSQDEKWVAFRSCLAQNAGSWQPSPTGPPAIYLIDPAGGGLTQVSPGNLPQWKPK
jgi:Tol biopolymer transport system component